MVMAVRNEAHKPLENQPLSQLSLPSFGRNGRRDFSIHPRGVTNGSEILNTKPCCLTATSSGA